MIELIKVGKYFPTGTGRHYLFRDVSLVLPRDKNVGVIGPNGSGKSTFLRLLSGAELPSEGRVVRTGKISWSLGMSPGLQPTMTGAENTRFASRIYGLPRHEIKATIEKVRELADVGKYFDMPIRTFSAGMRQKLSFAMSMAMEFEYYLFDEISAGGDVRFRERTQKMIKERLAKSNFVVVTHNHSEIVDLCHSCILIGGGNLTYFENVQEALETYNKLFGSPETERKAQAAARRAAKRAAAESGAAEAAPEAAGSRRVKPLPMAPRSPHAPPPAVSEAGGHADASAASAAREEKAAEIARKRAEMAARKAEAAERRQEIASKKEAAKAAAEQRARERADRQANIAAQKAAVAERKAAAEARKERRALRESRLQAAPELPGGTDAGVGMPAPDRPTGPAPASVAASPGPSKRRPLQVERHQGARPQQPIVRLRQSIAALKDQLAAASGQGPSAEVKRIRRELADAREQIKEIVAARQRHAGAAPEPGQRTGGTIDPTTSLEKQSDE